MDALEKNLRPLLTPITHNLPGPVRDFATSLLGLHCYKQLAIEVNLQDSDCVKLAVSKALGVGIISAASIVKIPQLLKLLNSQSADGISFLSYLLETSSFLITLAYNSRQGFPFSTYGETALISVQNVAIAVLVLQYTGRGPMAVALVAGLVAAGYTLFSQGLVDMKTLSLLQAGAGVLGVAAKVPQILTVWKQGGTGQLSAFAVCYSTQLLVETKKHAVREWWESIYADFWLFDRYSTTSLDRCREFSPRCKRLMIR